MKDNQVCPVCDSLISSIWMCTIFNCPEHIKQKCAEDRKKYLESTAGNDEEEKDGGR
jgi:hypothetical protein